MRIVLTILLAIGVCSVIAEGGEYISNKACKLCHNKPDDGAQWKVWTKTAHFRSIKTLSSEASLVIAKERGLNRRPEASPECLKCHATAYKVEKESSPAPLKVEDGVQCESCHAPGKAHAAAAKAWRLGKVTLEELHAVPILPEKRVCITCHNTNSPTWRDGRYSLSDGTTSGFNRKRAFEKIRHDRPEKTKALKSAGK